MVELDMTLPRSVLVAEDSFYRELFRGPDTVALLENTDAMVIPYSSAPEVNETAVSLVRDTLLAAGQLVPQALLVRNPYEIASFEFSEYAIETFASAKYHALANVARLLGARKVDFLEAKLLHDAARLGGDASGKAPAGGGNADFTREVTKKLEERLEGRMSFPGSDAAPDEALAYLVGRRLSSDQQLRSLVEMRTGANPISEYKMTLSGTRESAANFKSALSIANAGPVKAVNIGGAFSRTAESISSIEITTEITF